MYRVMIVDDEKPLRNLLKGSVDWSQMNLVIAGEAASGIEAINIMDDVRPDIMFVDVKMPFMDGIQFAKITLERYPRIQVIILTAFDEFKYARDCIGIGVLDYLLKPISADDIQKICQKAIKRLDEMPEPVAMQWEKNQSNMEKIRDYIKKDYANEQMNLAYVAQEFGFNASYLSRKFKEEMGIGLTEYITKIRMERAMGLAKAHTMMYQTAKEVGIPDSNYFGKCFKKYTGMPYSQVLKGETEE